MLLCSFIGSPHWTSSFKTKMKRPISKLKQNFLQFKHSFNKHLDKYSLYYRLFNISSIVIGFLIALFSYGAGVILVYPILFLFALIVKPSFFYYTTYLLLLVSLSIISKYYLLSHANFTMKLIILMTQWQNWFLWFVQKFLKTWFREIFLFLNISIKPYWLKTKIFLSAYPKLAYLKKPIYFWYSNPKTPWF